MGQTLAEMREVEEWQVVLSKRNDDPFEVDQLEVRVAPRKDADRAKLAEQISTRLHTATEVAPNKVTLLELDELLKLLGMETAMKEQRYVDRRPK
jgi:hypothetical protein